MARPPNPRYSGLRAANERRKQEAIACRAAVGAPASRTLAGRVSRAKYATPEARKAGALATRRARQATNLRDIIIPISDDVSEPTPRRPSLSNEERQARRAANMNRPTIEFSELQVVENPRRTTISVRPFSGGSSLHVPDFLKKGYGGTVVLNEDNSCGLRCLVLAMCTDVKLRNLLKPARASQFTKEVKALALTIG